MPPIHLSSDDDGEYIFNPQSPSPQSKNHSSKIPLMKSSSLRSSLDNSLEESSPFSTASPKAIETVRQITRLETPLKKLAASHSSSSQPPSGLETPKRSYNYGFTVTPFESKTAQFKKEESPSAEELLRRLANTREQFNQTLNAERTSPKILSKTIEDGWKGMSEFLKQPASPFTSSKQQQQNYAQFVSLDDQVSETESLQLKNSIAAYEDTKSRLERIRQKSKEMLSSNSTASLTGTKGSGGYFYFYTFLLFVCFSAVYFVFFDEKLVLQLFEYRPPQVNFTFFRTLELPPVAYEDFYAKLKHYLEIAQEYGELSIEWARDKFDL